MSFVLRVTRLPLALALGVVLPVAHVTAAFAQGTGGAGPAGGAAGAPGGAGPSGGTTTTTTTSTSSSSSVQFFPGGVAPTSPGQTLGGGNVQFSSSKPILGPSDRDTFDFKRGGSSGTAYGNPEGSYTLGTGGAHMVPPNASTHTVRKGDTLWALCDNYFQNPYQWPRIWSYNPQIQNPHWIYPGDQIRLRTAGGELAAQQAAEPPAGPGIVDRRRQVPPDTVFLQTEGFVEDERENNWGEINGAREDKMILTDFDEVYVRVLGNRDLKVGQELTVYRPLQRVGDGRLVQIQGTVKVDHWNEKEHIARARIIESLDAIERGARVGPVTRRFEVVPPSRNDKDVEATVLTSVRPHKLFGQNQVVFIDKGEEDGLEPGNRLFVMKKGDGFHRTLPAEPAAKRIALESNSPAATERVPRPRDEEKLPEEVQAELRVITVRKHQAMVLVTASRREIESGDKAFARKGY